MYWRPEKTVEVRFILSNFLMETKWKCRMIQARIKTCLILSIDANHTVSLIKVLDTITRFQTDLRQSLKQSVNSLTAIEKVKIQLDISWYLSGRSWVPMYILDLIEKIVIDPHGWVKRINLNQRLGLLCNFFLLLICCTIFTWT